MKVAGLVLAGGRSSRYGKQKLFERVENNPLFMKSVLAFQESQVSSFYIVTNQELADKFRPYPVICESSAYRGPLSALYSGMVALSKKGYSHILLLAGDLPRVDAHFVNQLMGYIEQFPGADIILPEHNERLQPLHAVYQLSCLATLTELSSNEKSMRSFMTK